MGLPFHALSGVPPNVTDDTASTLYSWSQKHILASVIRFASFIDLTKEGGAPSWSGASPMIPFQPYMLCWYTEVTSKKLKLGMQLNVSA